MGRRRSNGSSVNEQYEGRLELTWTNKHQSLLAHEDGSYEWLPESDYRVAEVRLLHDVLAVGDVAEKGRSCDNLLIQGDALHALTSLIELPEFAAEYLGKIKLVYIDPPFNTGEAFKDYDDNLEHSVWLTMMRDRLRQIEKLLAPDGSVWVHLNDDEVHYAKAVMDEVFTRANFVASFVWQKVDSPSENKKAIAVDHDYILCYSKVPGKTRFSQKPDPSVAKAFGSIDEETGRRYRDRLLKKNGKDSLRSDRWPMWFGIPGPDGEVVYPIHDDGREARWSVGRETVEGWLEQDRDIADPRFHSIIWKQRPGQFVRIRPEPKSKKDDDGKPRWKLELDSGKTRWVPYTREWAPESPTRPWPTMWASSLSSQAQDLAENAIQDDEFEALDPGGPIAQAFREIAGIDTLDDVKTTRQAKSHLRKLFPGVTSFETPKPEELMARILSIATREGDVVLDCFAGSGSTLSTAHKLGRRWIGIEWESETLETFTIPRLQKVTSGEDPGGITKAVGWKGDGGFRVLDVAPSMFAAVDGMVFLADWATYSALGEATAAQLGYEYEPDAPFCGRKGRTRLAVIDGLVNVDVVRLLVDRLTEKERLLVCGTALEDEAFTYLRDSGKGSIRKIPAAILRYYERPSRLRSLLELAPTEGADRTTSEPEAVA
jgi:adenine-specific DNA-methyltransferase